MSRDDTLKAWARRLKKHRTDRLWSETDLATEMKKLRADLPSVDTLARTIRRSWETGAHLPTPRYRMLLARVFATDEDALFGDNEPVLTPADVDDDVRRRELLGLLGIAAAAPIVGGFEPLRVRINEALTGAPTVADADEWERVAADYALEVGRVPTSQVLPDLLTDFAELGTALGAAKGLVRHQLLRASAELAALTAIALSSAADYRASNRWWRTAARAADESGDRTTSSLVRGRHAVFSLYDRRRSPVDVVAIAGEAITVADNQPCVGVVSGYAATAQAYARLGRHDAASATVEALQDLFGRLPDPVKAARAGQWGWGEQRLHHVLSDVHTHAGDIERAFAAQDAALRLYPVTGSLGRTQVELHRAGCLIRAGDVDEGAKHAVRVLRALPPDRRSDGLVRASALTALTMGEPMVAHRPAFREAYEVLTLEPGDL
ncbi:hypothetical protein LO762_07845 [Actinocorallia sp. API 0066]|uniref:hypothetical protein n=1 Tax=Actinocorallia sp. API 0066 TaxID=2896846 RepID=UPI001E376C09|nr:hypothetical protein [Actinocorallia sp. API 0066]MCD0449101.1 hypothetical protein [Actinocorallia sp. API 0066]